MSIKIEPATGKEVANPAAVAAPEKEKGPAPRTGHTKQWAKNRAKEKARRKAARKQRGR